MTPITRWFAAHVSAPLDRIYRRLDEHAAQLDPQPEPEAGAKKRRPHHRFRKAA